MNLDEFQHGIRAAREVLARGRNGALVIMGSQSILAAYSPSALDRRLMMSAIDPQVVRTGLESIYDERAARAIERVDAMSVSGLPDADRKAWHRRRRQALRDRLRKKDETSPAEVLLEIVDARTDDA